MLSFLKNILRRSATVRRIYARLEFFVSVVIKDITNPARAALFWRVMPYTMVGYDCVRNVYDLSSTTVRRNVQGAFVECGVWKGGAAGVMGYVADKEGKGRQVWLFDSFEGLPEPTEADGIEARSYAGDRASGDLSSIGRCVGPLEDVKRLFLSVLKLRGTNVHIEQGWFQNTLSAARSSIGLIAVLRLDADWYESTKCALENLYDLVVPGGYVILDDYGHWEGCRKAVDEFLEVRGLEVAMRPIDAFAVYFQKP